MPEPGEHLDLGTPDIIVRLLAHELGHIPLSAPGFGCAGHHHFDWTLGREPRAVAVPVPLAVEDQTVARGPQRAPMRSSFRMASASHWRIKGGGLRTAPLVSHSVDEQRGDIPKAREHYGKVLALNPRFAPAANNLAWILSEHGSDKDKALTLAQTAKELAPEDPQVSDTLGWIFYRRGVHQRTLARTAAA